MSQTIIKPRHVAIARILTMSALLVAVGCYFFYPGWCAFVDGEVLIKGKNVKPHMAYAQGPTSAMFYRYIWKWLICDGVFMFAGIALTGCLIFLPEKQKNLLLQNYFQSSGGARIHAPWVAAGVLALTLFWLLALDVCERGIPPKPKQTSKQLKQHAKSSGSSGFHIKEA